MILLPKVLERADNQWGTLPFVEAGHISHTGISQKEPSSFRTHGKPFIILMLHAERYFGHLSVILHSVWVRTENRSAEIEKSFGAELFTISCKERRLKDARNIFQTINHYMTSTYRTT